MTRFAVIALAPQDLRTRVIPLLAFSGVYTTRPRNATAAVRHGHNDENDLLNLFSNIRLPDLLPCGARHLQTAARLRKLSLLC
jgi:hypothetical protein